MMNRESMVSMSSMRRGNKKPKKFKWKTTRSINEWPVCIFNNKFI